jgi:hypothetical protein
MEIASGTGFCLDQACRFIGTNYHVARLAQLRRIKGEKIVERYLATGPDDEGATVNSVPAAGSMKYTLDRDLAIFELRRSLPHLHGLAFSLNDLQVGQEVDIYAYPKEGITPIRKLLQFPGTFKAETTDGLLAFDYELSNDKSIRGGASGGVIVDRKTQQIVGILSGIKKDGDSIALAVPIPSLMEFVSRVQPFLAQQLFPARKEISPVSADYYPQFVPPAASGALGHRAEESPQIKLLRNKAQLLSEGMHNFLAVENLAWGSGDNEPAALASYEILAADGSERYRQYPDGTKLLRKIPEPPMDTNIVPGNDWSSLPRMVGTELGLHIRQAPNIVVNGQQLKVFQYWANSEDGVCEYDSITDYMLFARSKRYKHTCFGEAWTDMDTNILRMSMNYEDFDGWKNFGCMMTYGWLRRDTETPRLIPVTLITQGRRNKKVYWCRSEFTNYQVFAAESRIIAK